MDFTEVRAINRALIRVAKLLRAEQSRLLAELGLHPGQDLLLWTLGQAPEGLLVNEIADQLAVESPTITRSLARLDPGGWITRHPEPGDRRAVRVRLSRRAQDVLPRIEANWRALAETATAGLDPRARQQLATLMDAVQVNLSDALKSSGPEGLAPGCS